MTDPRNVNSVHLHEVHGNNFHGSYYLRLRGPQRPFWLSDSQVRRLDKELCPFADCKCGGGYGDGPAQDSALIFSAYAAPPPIIAAAGGSEGEDMHDGLILVPLEWWREHGEEINALAVGAGASAWRYELETV